MFGFFKNKFDKLKKEKMNEFRVTVIYYFTSGLNIKILYENKETLDDDLKFLKKNWCNGIKTSQKFGINFQYVTHYTIEE